MFSVSKEANHNYLAKIVVVKNLRKHSNADRLQIFTVDGNNVITGLDAKEGDMGVYFPLECAIEPWFLSATDSFKDNLLNKDITKKGFFEAHGRVKALSLRGEKSEGYYVPYQALYEALGGQVIDTKENIKSLVGTEFDTVEDKLLVKKYIPKSSQSSRSGEQRRGNASEASILVENQFRFHADTPQLGKNMHKVSPDDVITITDKLHGTSFVSSNVLCKRKLGLLEKFAKWLGVAVVEQEYQNIYSSRSVVKNDRRRPLSNSFLGTDIWGQHNEEIKDLLPKGITVYGEIVGYTKQLRMIQKGYDYGCVPGDSELYIYRITYTNVDGKVFEFSWTQIVDFCNNYGLKHVPILYHGKAKNLFPISEEYHFHENFLECLKQNYLEKDCTLCVNKVPAEGITLRIDSAKWEIFKLKSFGFLEGETKALDAGEVDLETVEALAV